VLSSLTLLFRILWAEFIVVTVISIRLSPDGPEYVGSSFSFAVSNLCNYKKSTSILPLMSVVGLYHILCLLFASRPQIKFVGFKEVIKLAVGMRFFFFLLTFSTLHYTVILHDLELNIHSMITCIYTTYVQFLLVCIDTAKLLSAFLTL